MAGPQESSGRIAADAPTACSQAEPAAQSRPSGLRPLAQHTPTPWLRDHQGMLRGADWTEVELYCSGLALAMTRRQPAEANADFLFRAVNAHDDLLAELQEIASMIRAVPEGGKRGATLYFGAGHIAQITAAIAKATGTA